MDPLNSEQVEAFWREGYLVLDGAVSAYDLADLQAVIGGWVEESRNHVNPWGTTMDGRGRFDVQPGHSAERPALRRVASPQEVCDVHLRIMRDSPLVDAAAQLVGPNLAVNNVKTNCKQPGVGTTVRFHQDLAYEAHSNDDMLAALLFVDDVTLDNGPLEVLPGTHRGPIFDHWQDGVFTGTIADRDLAGLGEPVACFGPAGSACLMHTRLVHGSAANLAEHPRTLAIFSYRSEDSRILHPNHLPSIHEGEVVRGVATGRVRASSYEMALGEKPTTASFFDQQAQGDPV
ncbi:MAG: phytanoyl-CoA dioxygenase family protein [Acidimicrobiales bacterium]|nr:phytanoyl-CoA dioxygenase family protein [Acidimicrobiales bacterium]